ncbi:hypothetical protein [Atribacter laminatus]|uniref:Uncharacterized protein n=1 Tax=Atribacter laminatus TaxID=2847778 RepID=A0A7T1ALM2_ATRLM|nr:hypothetical protein [Atribacter laminatus]QPM68210.1 hypothetical protein RT761_01425 [Atribacter laminatus]
MRKKPSRKFNPPEGKSPRNEQEPESIISKLITWHIRTMDKEGLWHWKNISLDIFWDKVHKILSCYEMMTWGEVLNNRNNHFIPVNNLCKKAQQRLQVLKQDDIDEVVSFHINGKGRIWGIQDRYIFKILWWDPNHQVCPSHKKHT